MASIADTLANIKSTITTEVPAGSTAVLNCNSNDYAHNFMFWLFDKNKVIGPGNDFDERKYKYEVLSGKLHIDSVSPSESGYYKCVSKNIDGSGISVGEIEMIVRGSAAFSAADAVKLIAIVVSIIVIISCAVIYYRLRREWKREAQQFTPVDDEDEDGDGEEIYNRTTTAITQPAPGPSRNVSSEHLFGIDNQGLDTDFNSVFENIQIKSPQPSLI